MTPAARTGGLWALATGSGKDATLALHRAREAGLEVSVGFNLYDAATARVAFHGTRKVLVEAHCRALGLEPLLVPVGEDGFEPRFLEVLETLSRQRVRGVIFGNIHLADVRGWYEERVRGAGLEHREPLWGEPPGALVREVVRLGYDARVVSVDLERGDPSWLGRRLDPALLDAVEAWGADPCGEHGEYHTFVCGGPEFRASLDVDAGEVVEMKGHRFLDLRLPGAPTEIPMLDQIRTFFQAAMNPPEEADPSVRDRELRLAACALLLELAYADDEFTEDERTHLRNAVRRQYGLDSAQADKLIRMAERERVEAVDLWQFTNLIRQNYSQGQKMVLAEIMWGLVYSDGDLARREEYLMRKISNLLDLQAGYLSAARRRAEEGDAAPPPPVD